MLLVSSMRKPIDHTDVIISLTSFGVRCNSRLVLVLKSLALQSVRPAKVICYLTEPDYSENSALITRLTSAYANIYFVISKDYRSYKKIIPLLESGYQGRFITADDDIYYRRDWLKILLNEKISSGEICTTRAHSIVIKNGKLSKYLEWNWLGATPGTSSTAYFATTGAGVLLDTSYFSLKDFDWTEIREKFWTVDDVFIFYLIRKKGLRYKLVSGGELFVELYDPRLASVSLNTLNNVGHGNDRALEYVFHLNNKIF